MQPSHTIQNRNVPISVQNFALWDMKQVQCGISEQGQSYTADISRDYGMKATKITYRIEKLSTDMDFIHGISQFYPFCCINAWGVFRK